MNWKKWYRFLVSVRRWLNTLIDAARARAFPDIEGRRKRAAVHEPTPEQQQGTPASTPFDQPKDYVP